MLEDGEDIGENAEEVLEQAGDVPEHVNVLEHGELNDRLTKDPDSTVAGGPGLVQL